MTEPDTTEQELAWRGFVLNNLVASLMILAVLLILQTSIFLMLGLDDGAALIITFFSLFIYLAIYLTSKKKDIRWAIHAFSLYAILVSFVLSYGWGVADITSSAMYAGAIIMVSLLLRGRVLLLAIGVLLIGYLTITGAELAGWFSPPFYTELGANRWAVALFLLYLGGLGFMTGMFIDRVLAAQVFEAARRQELESRTQIAAELQLSLLPANAPTHPHFEIEGYSFPARDVGGDFYNFYHLGDDLVIIIGDITGKGIPAALLMAVTTGIIDGLVPSTTEPGQLLVKIAGQIEKHCQRSRLNIACLVAFLQKDRLRVANAGCIEPLIRRADGRIEWLEASGLPLGTALGPVSYEQQEILLAPEDMVLFLTDGIVEAQNSFNHLLGFESLEHITSAGPGHSAEAMIEHVVGAMRTFQGEVEQIDDTTVVAVRVKKGTVYAA